MLLLERQYLFSSSDADSRLFRGGLCATRGGARAAFSQAPVAGLTWRDGDAPPSAADPCFLFSTLFLCTGSPESLHFFHLCSTAALLSLYCRQPAPTAPAPWRGGCLNGTHYSLLQTDCNPPRTQHLRSVSTVDSSLHSVDGTDCRFQVGRGRCARLAPPPRRYCLIMAVRASEAHPLLLLSHLFLLSSPTTHFLPATPPALCFGGQDLDTRFPSCTSPRGGTQSRASRVFLLTCLPSSSHASRVFSFFFFLPIHASMTTCTRVLQALADCQRKHVPPTCQHLQRAAGWCLFRTACPDEGVWEPAALAAAPVTAPRHLHRFCPPTTSPE